MKPKSVKPKSVKPKRVVSFGELMVRLSPPSHQRIRQATQFDVCYAGGEANVAVSLANYGLDAAFVSKIPSHELGDSAVRMLKGLGVDVQHIVREGKRIGIYYLEHGASIRPSKVIYDREHSAIAEASLRDFDFKAIFRGAQWFHVSGITPALSDNCARLTLKALKTAKEQGLWTSFDLNYRKKLWTPEQARKTCEACMKYVDVCIGNEEDLEKALGARIEGSNIEAAELNVEGYKKVFAQLQKKHAFKYIACTLRESYSASDNGWSALLYDGKRFFQSKRYKLHVVDRVGAGDAFAAGLIHAFLGKKTAQRAVDFATAASALKHTIHGDLNLVTMSEVESLAQGNTSGRVER